MCPQKEGKVRHTQKKGKERNNVPDHEDLGTTYPNHSRLWDRTKDLKYPFCQKVILHTIDDIEKWYFVESKQKKKRGVGKRKKFSKF